MKKTLTLAIMALLMGCFTINANAQFKKIQTLDSKSKAQETKTVKPTTKETTPTTKVVKVDGTQESATRPTFQNVNTNNQNGKTINKNTTSGKDTNTVINTDWGKKIAEYEEAVDKCVSLFQKMQKGGSNNDAVDKEYKTTLTSAETLRNEIGKAKNQLDRTQVDRYNKATNKLSQVYARR